MLPFELIEVRDKLFFERELGNSQKHSCTAKMAEKEIMREEQVLSTSQGQSFTQENVIAQVIANQNNNSQL